MELLKQFFIQRLILYIIIAVFSFFVIVPLGDLRLKFTDDHCSRCLLYSDISLANSAGNNTTGTSMAITFGDQEVCEYSIAVSSVFCLIYPLIMGALYFYFHRRDSAETREENKLDLAHFLFWIHIAVEIGVVVLTLVSAAMISRGFMHICEGLVDGGIIESCMDAEKLTDWKGYDGSNFFISLSVATAGSWLVWTSWVLQGLLGVWKLWRLNMLPALGCCDRHGDSGLP